MESEDRIGAFAQRTQSVIAQCTRSVIANFKRKESSQENKHGTASVWFHKA